MSAPTLKGFAKTLPTADAFRQLVPGAAAFVGAQLSQSAAYYNGNTYVAYIDGGGAIRVAKVNKATGAVTISPAIKTFATPDQHSTPAVLVRSSDHKLIVVACDVAITDGTHVWKAVSTNAEDVSAWGAASDIAGSLTGSPYTYHNLVQLSGESAKIYDFFSAGFPPTQEIRYITSTDGGVTWAAPTRLWSASTNCCFWAINSDDTSRIDFALSDGHALNGQTGSLYHCYYDGAFRKTDGTSMGSPPFVPANATKIYDGATNGSVRVPYAIQRVGSSVAIVWAACQTSNPTTTPESYWYGVSASGGAWSVHSITDAGRIDLNHEVEGGIMIDPADINHVILSKSGDLLSYRTSNSGTSWTNDATLTSDGAFGPNLRPFAPHNADPTLSCVFLYGPFPTESSARVGAQIRGYPA